MLIPREFLTGHDQLAGAFGEQVVAFADRPFHQLGAAVDEIVGGQCGCRTVGRAGVDRLHVLRAQHLIRDRVMQDLPCFEIRRTNLDHLDPARLGDRDVVGHRAIPHVLAGRRHLVFGAADHEIGRTETVLHAFPFVVGGNLLRGRQVFRVALRRAGVDPRHDGVDLFLRQRHVVLEFLHADALIDVPRRHLPRRDALLDRPRPRPRLGEGHERHRRDRIRLMAFLALGLHDWRDVFGEGRSGLGAGGRCDKTQPNDGDDGADTSHR